MKRSYSQARALNKCSSGGILIPFYILVYFHIPIFVLCVSFYFCFSDFE